MGPKSSFGHYIYQAKHYILYQVSPSDLHFSLFKYSSISINFILHSFLYLITKSIMGVSTFIVADDTSSVAPTRLFKALCLDSHNFMPKALPEFVKSVEFVQGDSTTVGCVKQLNFPEGSPFKYLKNRVDEIDEGNFYLKYTVIEGDVLDDSLECVVYESKFEASGSGSHYKITAHYHTKGDVVKTEADITPAKEGIKKTYKIAEEYLTANPELYA